MLTATDPMVSNSVEYIDEASFFYYCIHLKVKFESLDNGWFTFSTAPHKHTGRVFKIITNCQMNFHKDDEIPMESFITNFIDKNTTWGEIHKDGVLLQSTRG